MQKHVKVPPTATYITARHHATIDVACADSYQLPRNGDTVQNINISGPGMKSVQSIVLRIIDFTVWEWHANDCGVPKSITIPHVINLISIFYGYTCALFIKSKKDQPCILDISLNYHLYDDYETRKTLAHAKMGDFLL